MNRLATCPPTLAERLLVWTVPAGKLRQTMLGDLNEEFAGLVAVRSRFVACVWYWCQVLPLVFRFGLRSRTGVQSLRGGLGAAGGGRPGPGRYGSSGLVRRLVSDFAHDLRVAWRGLMRTPGFTVVAVITLALGIGATSAIFSVVSGIVLRPLAFPAPEQLVRITSTEDGFVGDNVSGANYVDWRAQSESFDDMAGYVTSGFNVVAGEGPRRVRGAVVTNTFFNVMGVPAALGRTFSPDRDPPSGDRRLVLSYGFWQSEYAGDVTAVGRQLKLGEDQYTIVGVMPPGFEFPGEAQLWAAARYRVPDPPFDFGEDPAEVRGAEYFDVIARLRAGVDLSQAQSEMNVIASRLEAQYPDVNAREGIGLIELRDDIVGSIRPVLYVLLAAVGFVLLIACANVANLLLVRAACRDREMALRMALGAGRRRILRQLVTESVLLSMIGAGTGVVLARWGTRALFALAPADIPRAAEVHTDIWVLGFTAAVAIVTGVLFGLAPATRLFGGTSLGSSLVGGARHTGGLGRSRLRNALIVGEVGVSLMLLVGAGLMVRTLQTLNRVDPGFRIQNIFAAYIALPSQKYIEDEKVMAFYRDVLERVRALPGVESAGAVLSLPVRSGINGDIGFAIEGRSADENDGVHAGYQLSSPDYFGAIGIPLRRGRLFTEADREDAALVAIVNEALAALYWPGEDPVGQRVTWGDGDDDEADWATIVGIVGNTRHNGLDEAVRPEIFRPFPQGPMPFMTFVTRSAVDPADMATAVRQAVMEVDAEQPLSRVATMESIVSDSLGWRRFNMFLLGVFALTAMVMAAVGLLGVLSFSVTQRSSEIGIKMALGARAGLVVRQVVWEGVRLSLIGLVLGGVGAFGATRLMSSMIYGVGVNDPLSYVLGAALLAATAVLATLLPALNAARVDPMRALQTE